MTPDSARAACVQRSLWRTYLKVLHMRACAFVRVLRFAKNNRRELLDADLKALHVGRRQRRKLAALDQFAQRKQHQRAGEHATATSAPPRYSGLSVSRIYIDTCTSCAFPT